MTRTGRNTSSTGRNPKGVHAERWLHAHGCQRWFNALRDTASDRIVETYAMGEAPATESPMTGQAARDGEARRLRSGRTTLQRGRLPKAAASTARKPITMRFNGRVIEAYAGDTVASALLANGIHLVGRSFKYHRPRGIFSHGAEEPNALFVGRPRAGSRRSEQPGSGIEAVDGLLHRARRTTGRRSASMSGRSTTCCRRFSSPASTTRPSCGRGPSGTSSTSRGSAPPQASAGAPSAPDPDRYQHAHAHCDVLVVGAGPAGLAAALAASESGKRVILADEQAGDGRRAAART